MNYPLYRSFFLVVCFIFLNALNLPLEAAKSNLGPPFQQIVISSQQELPVKSPQKHSKKNRKQRPPYDYGERSQLTAFLLCLMLGFMGAHHFYLNHYLIASIQLSFFLLIMAFVLVTTLAGLVLAYLLLLGLFGWVVADLLLLIFGGMKAAKRKNLIPWDEE